jgi:hypothetical protein
MLNKPETILVKNRPIRLVLGNLNYGLLHNFYRSYKDLDLHKEQPKYPFTPHLNSKQLMDLRGQPLKWSVEEKVTDCSKKIVFDTKDYRIVTLPENHVLITAFKKSPKRIVTMDRLL